MKKMYIVTFIYVILRFLCSYVSHNSYVYIFLQKSSPDVVTRFLLVEKNVSDKS